MFGQVSKIFELGKWIEKLLAFCGNCRDRLLTWLGILQKTLDSEEKSSTEKSTTQADFIDDKYIEYFEDIENRTKSLEEKLHLNNKSLSKTIEDRSKNLEEKLDQILNNNKVSESIENKTKNLENKLENISKNFEDKLDKLTSLLSQR